MRKVHNSTFLQGLTKVLMSVDGVSKRFAIACLWLGSVLLRRVTLPSSFSTKVALLNRKKAAGFKTRCFLDKVRPT